MARTQKDQDLRKRIEDATYDIASNLAYYDRKGSEGLPLEEFNEAVRSGLVTEKDIVGWFRTGLRDSFRHIKKRRNSTTTPRKPNTCAQLKRNLTRIW